MRLNLRLDLATDPRTAARLLADPAFVRDAIEASGGADPHVDVTGKPDAAFTVTTRRSLPADQIPAHLRGFVGARIDVRQVDAWEPAGAGDERIGTVAIDIAGAPVRMTGRTRLWSSSPGTTTVEYDGDLHAAIPLFGAAVESAAARAIRAATAVAGSVAAGRLRPGSAPDRTSRDDEGDPTSTAGAPGERDRDRDEPDLNAERARPRPSKTDGDDSVTAP